MPERNHCKKLSALLRKETFFCENFKRVSPHTLGSAFDSTSIKMWPCKYLPALSLVYLSWGCLVSTQSSLKTYCSYVIYCLSVRNRIESDDSLGRRTLSLWKKEEKHLMNPMNQEVCLHQLSDKISHRSQNITPWFGALCPDPWFFFFFFPLHFFFKFYFIFKLYIIVLVLPNIKMNPPQVYMCSPS